MNWITLLALYFLIWWTVLFIVLPIGMRSQMEDNDIVLGTDHGAPTQFRPLRTLLLTTVISFLVISVYYVATAYFGLGLDSFPNFLPGIH